jgi:hypothetical protein
VKKLMDSRKVRTQRSEGCDVPARALVIEERPLKYLGLPGIGLASLRIILTMYLL